MKQMQDATLIAEFKYPRDKGYCFVWVFDHSGCHTAYADDALNVKMNLNPGGQQPRMRDTVWREKAQKLVFPDGTPKGLAVALRERGIYTRGMLLDDMKAEIAKQHLDAFAIARIP